MKGFLKWALILSLIIGICFSPLIYSSIFEREGADELYVLPNGYTGCIGIIPGIEGAPELKYKNGAITYNIPENGLLVTSSSSELGWAYEDRSGYHDVKYQYENGEKIPRDNVFGGGVYNTQRTLKSGKTIQLDDFNTFYVGKEENALNRRQCTKVITEKASKTPYFE